MERREHLEGMQLALQDMYALLTDLGIDPGEVAFDPGPDSHHWEREPRTMGQALGELAIRLGDAMKDVP